MLIRPRTVVTGALSYLPGAKAVYRRHFFQPGATRAMDSYGIWLKHASMAHAHGMEGIPAAVVELGPGSSIGVGLAALICGAKEYHGLDAVPALKLQGTLALFDELVELFRARTPPHNAAGFPRYAAGFPARLLPRAQLDALLQEDRLERLRRGVARFADGTEIDGALRYAAPWDEQRLDCAGDAGLVLSHAVLQHVTSVKDTFASIARLLCPGGYSTHQVSFDSHGITGEWNGHWACPQWAWKLALGRKDFLINRLPHSGMVGEIRASGLEVVADLTRHDPAGIDRSSLDPDWSWISEADLFSREAFIVARKAGPSTPSRAAAA
jgi:hypothetical protein